MLHVKDNNFESDVFRTLISRYKMIDHKCNEGVRKLVRIMYANKIIHMNCRKVCQSIYTRSSAWILLLFCRNKARSRAFQNVLQKDVR
jgi:hypothetical protein